MRKSLTLLALALGISIAAGVDHLVAPADAAQAYQPKGGNLASPGPIGATTPSTGNFTEIRGTHYPSSGTSASIGFIGSSDIRLFSGGSVRVIEVYHSAGGVFNLVSTGLSFSTTTGNTAPDLTLSRVAADTLGLYRSTNPQTIQLYNTRTDASNYERLAIIAGAGSNQILSQSAGTGSPRAMDIGTAGSNSLYFTTANVARWSVSTGGHILSSSHNAYDIGGAGATQPRNVYAATGVILGGVTHEASQTATISTVALMYTGTAGDYYELMVFGQSASNVFVDKVLYAPGSGVNPVVLSSSTMSGGPAARTYTISGNNVNLAMASGTYTIKARGIRQN